MALWGLNQTTKHRRKRMLKKPNLDKVVFGGTVLYFTTHNNIISCPAFPSCWNWYHVSKFNMILDILAFMAYTFMSPHVRVIPYRIIISCIKGSYCSSHFLEILRLTSLIDRFKILKSYHFNYLPLKLLDQIWGSSTLWIWGYMEERTHGLRITANLLSCW